MQIFRALDRLRAAAGVELGKKICCVGFDRAYRNEKRVRDLLIRKPLSDQFKHFVFAFADPDLSEICFVELKWSTRIDNFRSGQTKTGPNSESREHYCNRPDVEFERNIADEKPVFDKLQDADENSHRDRINEDGFTHGQKQKPSNTEV
jgi:hypothetical protein